MKEGKKMAVLLAVLVVLLGVFAGLKLHNSREEKRAEQKEESEKLQLVELGDLQRLSYSDGSQEIQLEKQGDRWAFTDEPDVALEDSDVESMASEVTGLTALRRLEEPDALADYGLEKPSCTVEAADEDGNTCRIFVGNSVDSDYYLTVGDKKEVYTGGSSLVSALQYDKKELIKNDEVPAIGTKQVQRVTVKSPETGKTVYTAEKNEDEIATILGGVGALSFGTCVDYKVSGDALAQYGLDEASRITLKIRYKDDEKEEKKEFVLHIGKADDSGTYRYVQVDGSSIVNEALTDTVKNLLNEGEEE